MRPSSEMCPCARDATACWKCVSVSRQDAHSRAAECNGSVLFCRGDDWLPAVPAGDHTPRARQPGDPAVVRRIASSSPARARHSTWLTAAADSSEEPILNDERVRRVRSADGHPRSQRGRVITGELGISGHSGIQPKKGARSPAAPQAMRNDQD
jgi:hypothetical protein